MRGMGRDPAHLLVGEERLGGDRPQRDADRPRLSDRLDLGRAGGEQGVGRPLDLRERQALAGVEVLRHKM